jgi:RHS repeat-associated protein
MLARSGRSLLLIIYDHVLRLGAIMKGNKIGSFGRLVHKTFTYIFFCFFIFIVAEHRAHAGNITYIYSDPTGTPLMEADADGVILKSFDRRPFGMNVEGGTQDGPGFAGHYDDADTGFTYMQARFYDPVVGRFVTPDPIKVIGNGGYGFNAYAYVYNNPIGHSDPDGRLADNGISGDRQSHQTCTVSGWMCIDQRCSVCLDTGKGGYNVTDLPAVNVHGNNNSAGATAGAAIGFVLSLPVDAFEDFFSGGLGVLVNPATTAGMTAGGAAIGAAAQSGLTSITQAMANSLTDHGSERAEQAKTDPTRNVGDRNNVIKNGRKYIDNDTGHNVFVDGDRVVVVNKDGDIVTQFTNSRANTLDRVQSGKWTPTN